ncbi:hypothetical protein [Microbispora bryophytorum]|uniref:Uncharacterized protein n=1 Tax=Microbispora bryophytorum subsp. camponoti TaxID=1677852 RepID=A0ABR8LC87_9ACTN|nr:hypothetical protein [Microbispora camponoti]MBD3148484.1 hypothetical protein [Microbispora camponoti]
MTGVDVNSQIRMDPEGRVTLETWGVDHRFMVVRGRNYASAAAAEASAEKWRAALMVAFAQLNIGADFGTRAPQSELTDTGRRLLQGDDADQPRQVLDDVHGILVFPSEPAAAFAIAMPMTPVLSRPIEDVVSCASALADQANLLLDDAQLVAHSLFASSFSETSVDARFLMLMMAIETIIKRDDRSLAVVAHVNDLLEQTKQVDLPVRERDALLGALRDLRKQSIGQAGQALASMLGDQRFAGETPADFFKKSYTLRSQLGPVRS